MKLKLRHYAAALAVGGSLVLAGCSSDTEESTNEALTQNTAANTAAVQNARQANVKAGTAQYAGTVTTSSKEDGKSVVSMNGAYNIPANSMEGKIVMNVSLAELDIKVKHVNGETYVKAPALNDLLGNRWVKFDLSSLGVKDPVDPAQALKHIDDYKDLEDTGPDVVDGVATTRYVGTTNITEALKDVGVDPEKVTKGGKGHAKVAVWVDDEGQLVQQETLVRTHVDGKAETVDQLIKFSDIGKPVNITAPPASNTLDISKYMSLDGLGLGDLNADGIKALIGTLDIDQIKAMVGNDLELFNDIKDQLPDWIDLDDLGNIVPELEQTLNDKGGAEN